MNDFSAIFVLRQTKQNKNKNKTQPRDLYDTRTFI